MKKGIAIVVMVLIVALIAVLGVILYRSYQKQSTVNPNPNDGGDNGENIQQPTNSLDPNADYYAVVTTNLGVFEIDLFEKNAPNTVNNFIYLSTINFYTDTYFHRLLNDVLVQGGSPTTKNDDPADDALGGPGYIFKDEINWDSLNLDEDTRSRLTRDGFVSAQNLASRDIGKYRVAMANDGSQGTNGSQFFIILGEDSKPEVSDLRGRHTVFGEVTVGREIIDAINEIRTIGRSPNDQAPADSIFIEKIEIFTK